MFCRLICRVLASLWLNLFLFECFLELVNFLEALQVLVWLVKLVWLGLCFTVWLNAIILWYGDRSRPSHRVLGGWLGLRYLLIYLRLVLWPHLVGLLRRKELNMLVKICIFVLWIHILIKRKVEFRPILFVFYLSDGLLEFFRNFELPIQILDLWHVGALLIKSLDFLVCHLHVVSWVGQMEWALLHILAQAKLEEVSIECLQLFSVEAFALNEEVRMLAERFVECFFIVNFLIDTIR